MMKLLPSLVPLIPCTFLNSEGLIIMKIFDCFRPACAHPLESTDDGPAPSGSAPAASRQAEGNLAQQNAQRTTSRQSSRQTELLAQVASRPKSKKQILAAWEKWKKQGTRGENRAEAFSNMRVWLDNNQPHARLHLTHLGLFSLPEILPDNLQDLDISGNWLEKLPESLPAGLQKLNAKGNNLRALPEMPEGLQDLNVEDNRLEELPESLPAGLQKLNAKGNKLRALPEMPEGLQELNVEGGRLEKLPERLPVGLQKLNAKGNNLMALPEMPEGLQELNVKGNRLEELPESLPAGLQKLNVNGNKLRNLPEMPHSLEHLDIGDNLWAELPELPAGLQYLDASGPRGETAGRLRHLPDLPDTLEHLLVNDHRLAHLPTLSERLLQLEVANNRLEELPEELPPLLERLNVARNRLKQLPEMPSSLRNLNISHNRLTDLPEQLESMNDGEVIITGNPLSEETRHRFDIVRSIGGVERLALGARRDSVPRLTLVKAVRAWYGTDDPARAAAWKKIYEKSPENSAASLQELLGKLHATAEHPLPSGDTEQTVEMRSAMRAAFKERVTTLLGAMEKDKELRELCFVALHNTTGGCHDNAALAFKKMEEAHLMLKASRGEIPQHEIFKLGVQFFKLQKLEELAQNKARQVKNEEEELEVVLYYRMKLADTLELPHQPQNMRYEGTATAKGETTGWWTKRETVVTDKDLMKAAATVQAAASDPEQLIQFLAEWEPWQKALLRRHPEQLSPAALEAAKEKLQQKLADLEDDEKNPGMNENQKIMESDKLKVEYDALDSTLFNDERKRLTQEFMRSNTASGSQSTA